MTKFSLSRQSVYQAMKPLADAGLVKKTRDYANLYTTLKDPDSIEAQTFFSGGVTPPHIRSHAIGFAFKILKNADNLTFKTAINMRNWQRFTHHIYSDLGQCTVMKHPNKLIVYVPEIRGRDARENEGKALIAAHKIAQDLADRYDLVLGMPKLVQKPHHAVIAPYIARATQRTLKEVGTVSSAEGCIDDSEHKKVGELELWDADDANSLLHIGSAVNEMRELVKGSVSTQNAIANTQMMLAASFKEMQKEMRIMSIAFRRHLAQRSLKEFP